MKRSILIVTLLVGLIACKKDNPAANPGGSTGNNPPGNTPDSTSSVPKKTAKDSVAVYEGLVFSANKANDQNQYFSTIDTSFKAPLSRNALTATQLKNVDIAYIHDYFTDSPGFMDPIASSTNSNPNEADIYYNPSLDSSIKTRFYITNMTKTDYDSVRSHPYLFGTYFQNATIAAGNVFFPTGTIIGDPYANVNLAGGMVIGFKNDGSGKHGFIYVRTDQEEGWPQFPITGFRTKVDILKEK